MSRHQIDRQQADTDLAARLRAGDERAFAILYERYWEPLFRYGARSLQDTALAEDAVQDVLVDLWERRQSLAHHDNLSGYLYRAMRNRVLNLLDRSKVRQAFLDTVAHTHEAGDWSTDEKLREQELAEQIAQGMQQLPEAMRRVFELSREQGLSHREIAETLAISENTVKVQVSRALKILRKSLKVFLSVFY